MAAGEVVAVYDGNTRLGNAVVSGSSWTFTPSIPLADGNHSLRAMIQDDATGTFSTGRVVSETTRLTVVTVLGAPAQTVTLNSVTESNTANGSVSGTFASGTSTDGTMPTLTGTLNAPLGLGETVAVYDGALLLGYASTVNTGWSFTTPALGPGSHSLTVQVDNILSGAHGVPTAAFVVIEQTIVSTGLSDDVGANQGPIAAAGRDRRQPTDVQRHAGHRDSGQRRSRCRL